MANGRGNPRKKSHKKRTRRIIFALEMIVLLVLLGGLFVYAQVSSKLNKVKIYEPTTTEATKTTEKKEEVVPDTVINPEVAKSEILQGYTNIALFGVDSREGNLQQANSDTQIIASINNDTKDVKLVSVYRDTYLGLGDGKYDKCNAAYLMGGPQKSITMLNTNLDLDITNYVAVDFEALIRVVDLLGGLEIGVSEEECVHLNNYCVELKNVTGTDYKELPGEGVYNMTGIQATAYARIRYTAGSDFKRTERQREVITKIVEKVKKSSIPTLTKIMDEVFPMISTNLSKSDMMTMGIQMLSYKLGEQTGFPFDHLEGEKVTKAMGGVDCVLPVTLENNVVQLHKMLFGDESYTVSDTVKKRSEYLIEKSGFGIKSIPKKEEQ